MNIVRIENIKKDFGSLEVLKGIDLILGKGEVLGLLGHNGAGKTTTMKMILGLLKPSSGQVEVFGQTPYAADFSHLRFRIGFLPENVSFYQQLTGQEVLRYFGKLKNASNKRCQELLEKVGLDEAKSRKVKTYSKGMKQRLGLAQALLTEPDLLLLDEPTVGLDPIATQQFYLIVDELRKNGCSIILCSHVLPGIEKHIDNVAILTEGKVRAYGSIEALRKETELPTIINFNGFIEIEKLSVQLDKKIQSHEDGSFSLDVNANQKLKVLQLLMKQVGLSDLNTSPANLEQIYRYYIENKSIQVPAKKERQNEQAIHLGVQL